LPFIKFFIRIGSRGSIRVYETQLAELTRRRQEDKKSLAVYRKEKGKLLAELRISSKKDAQMLRQVKSNPAK
jgi:hypothetical protein